MTPKHSIPLILSLALGVLSTHAAGEALVAHGDNVKVALTNADGQFEPGEIPFKIIVTDHQGNPLSDAKVALFYGMAPQDGMPPMMYETTASKKGKAYNAVLNVDMMGDWFIDVTVKREGKASQTIKFEKHFMNAGAQHGHMHN